MKFVHLHVHTHYSLLDGLTKLDELIAFVKKEESPAVAITDHGVMYGVIEFYQKCKKAGVKPIIGVESYLAPRSRHDKITRTDEKRNYHLLLLAKNNQGYKNLLKLTSIAHLEGYYYKPRIDWEVLEKHKEGLIACTACIGGEIPTLIRSGNLEKARQRALEYNNLFGQDNFYFEIQHHPDLEGQDLVNKELIKMSRELNIPLVATNDSHYLRREDDEAQDILLCMQGKKKKDDPNRMCMTGNDFSFRTTAQMIADFKDTPEAIENTVKIADMCNVEIELGKTQLPYFEVPDGFGQSSYLRKLCENGLEKRYDKNYNDIEVGIRERMDYELSVVERMGWPSYFLIVADFVNWAKNQGIVVGPGRGSAAGSLICYLTGITNLDPLKYDLLFERFLNPDRISMPDIDLDFADARRGEVLEYVENKYGKDHVAQIITFGTMAARAAVKDVGRVLGAPYDYMDKLAKAIPMFTKLDEALKDVDEFKSFYKSDPQAKNIIDYARRLEGVSRHSSTHACGVLITKDPLVENVPVQYASSTDRTIVSQYSLHPVEDLGLLKMDFLGLKNLTIIETAIKNIKKTQDLEIDIEKIPLDDLKAYKLFSDGETTGVFQFESSGMKRYLKELKPSEFEDVIAMVALYRPGPLNSGMVQEFIDRKHGKKEIVYNHAIMKNALKNTYGVIVYQEQVMQLSKDMAGFTGGQADTLRKAMGKKIAALMEKMKIEFVDGCIKNNLPQKLAEETFASMEKFAEYGFNKSHAACYAMVAYQTAYLKAHWPTEFMAALFTSDQQHIERLSVEIEEAQRMGIIVSRPDVNQSLETFTVVKSEFQNGELVGKRKSGDMIRFGLSAVKNMGAHIAEVLIDERKIGGVYKDLTDLLERVTDKDLNKKSMESLVKSGALDDFGERGMLLANIDNMLAFNKELVKNQNSKQSSLFADILDAGIRNVIRLNNAPAIDRQEMLKWEKELLGLYVSDHPFTDYKKDLENIILPLKKIPELKNEDQLTVAGIITKIQKIITKTNKSMLFVKIEDDSAGTEILVFPNLYKSTFAIWAEGKAVIVQGKKSDKDNETKILANTASAVSLRNIREVVTKFKTAEYGNKQKGNGHSYNQDLRLGFRGSFNSGNLERLRDIFVKHKGENKVIFEVGLNGQKKVIETDFRVSNSAFLLTEIKNKFGDLIAMY